MDTAYNPPSVESVSAASLRSSIPLMTSSGGSGGSSGGSKTPTKLERFKSVLLKNMGFDSTAATSLYSVLTALDSYYASKPTVYRAWAFFRLIGATVYRDVSIVGLLWMIITGSDEETNSVFATEETEMSFFVDKLGFSEGSRRQMKFAVQIQHELCNKASNYTDGLTIEDENISIYRRIYASCFGISEDKIDASRIITIVRGMCSHMPHRVDFAHMCITTAALLASAANIECAEANAGMSIVNSALVGYAGANNMRVALAGWLGDAMLPGNKEDLDSATSFGNDDYFSDADAIALSKKVINSSSAITSILSYYEQGFSGTRQRRYVYIDTYNKTRYDSTTVSIDSTDIIHYLRFFYWGDDAINHTNSEMVEILRNGIKYADTYEFYLYLKEGNEPTY